MTTAFVFSALFGGAVASFPLLKWGGRLKNTTPNQIERLLFLPLIVVVVWLLYFVLYPPSHATLILVFMPIATLALWLVVAITYFEQDKDYKPVFNQFIQFIAAGVIIGILASEGALAGAASGKFPYRYPSLYAWVGGNRTLPALLTALKDSDQGVRAAAAGALGGVGDKSVVSVLIAALKDSSDQVREEAAEALGRLGDSSAVPTLIAALKDSSDQVRLEAIKALGKMGEPAVFPQFNDSSDQVRLEAVKILAEIGEPAVLPLITWLKDSNDQVRLEAVKALVEIGEPAVLPLITEIKDNNDEVHIGQAEAVGALLASYTSFWYGSESDRRFVKLGPPAVPSLIAVLKNIDASASDRYASIGIIKEGLLTDDVVIKARKMAACSLGEIGDGSAAPALIATLKDENFGVRYKAARVLMKIGSPTMVPLIAALKDSNDKGQAVRMLLTVYNSGEFVKFGSPAVPLLIAALQDDDESTRIHAAQALAEIGDKSAVPALEAADQKHHWYIVCYFCIALHQLGAK